MSALVKIVQTVVAPETDKTALKISAGFVSILSNVLFVGHRQTVRNPVQTSHKAASGSQLFAYCMLY